VCILSGCQETPGQMSAAPRPLRFWLKDSLLLKSGVSTSLRRLFAPSAIFNGDFECSRDFSPKLWYLLFPVLVTCTVHSPVEGAKRRRFRVVHAMGDWLQRPQISKNSRQILVRQVAER